MPHLLSWDEPLQSPTLGADGVHVWCAAVRDVSVAEYAVLSPDEQEHAARFYRDRDRTRFALAHVMLRDVLSRYVGVPAASLAFVVSDHGKPSLERRHLAEWLSFNLSHSRDLVLCAVARGRELGVDVEYAWPDRYYARIAEQFFSPLELAQLHQMPPSRHAEAFFRCWTLKEAYLKARGEGLSLPLDSFDVAFAPGECPGLRRVSGQPGETVRWSFASFTPAPGYAAALAVEGRNWSLQGFLWSHAGVAVPAMVPS
jgi:4'-phosphopantetheinyl transferase